MRLTLRISGTKASYLTCTELVRQIQDRSPFCFFVPPGAVDARYKMAAPQLKTDSKYDDYDYPTTSPNVQSGHPGHTTPEQDAQVHQLRMQLEQAGYSERLDTLTMVSYLHATTSAVN